MPVYIETSQLCHEVELSVPSSNLPSFYRKIVASAYAYAYSRAFSLDISIRDNKNFCSLVGLCLCLSDASPHYGFLALAYNVIKFVHFITAVRYYHLCKTP